LLSLRYKVNDMGYNKFRWWSNGKMKPPLPKSAPLLLKIRNGDFEYSPYFKEAEDNRKESDKIYESIMKTSRVKNELDRKYIAIDAGRMKRVKALKLDEVGCEDEYKRLNELKKALAEEFGKCLWDKCLERQRGKGTTEDMYWWYKKECKMELTPSELAIKLGKKTIKGLK
jgi:hypothetical protein